MTIFIDWLKEDDAGFRKQYFNAVGEYIQDEPEDIGDFWRIGSSRATPKMLDGLPCTYSDKVEVERDETAE